VRLTGLRATFVTQGALQSLPQGIQLAVYRLVQEALTNTLKHAVDAQSASVRVRFHDARLEVDITDDGRISPSAPLSGHGITGMRERAALYGGIVDIGPQGGLGWRVHVRFDLGAREPVS